MVNKHAAAPTNKTSEKVRAFPVRVRAKGKYRLNLTAGHFSPASVEMRVCAVSCRHTWR